MNNKEVTLLNIVAQAIYDKKGVNILALDLRGISTLTDYVIIAEGMVDRHVIAIAKEIIDKLEKMGIKTRYVEGLKTGDWVVIDFFTVMVHLFMPGVRERYRLEDLWRRAKIVDLKINLTNSLISH